MTTIERDTYNLVFTGAGDSDLIEMTIEEMDIALTNDRPSGEWEIRKTLKRVLLNIFRDHIAPDPDILPEDRPELLIGLQYEAATLLYKACGTKFRRLHAAECIGKGIVLAKCLTAQLFDPGMTLVHGGIVALYILNQTKRWVDGCGGNSDILLLSHRNRIITRIPTQDIKTLESHFDNFNEHLRPILVGCADGKMSQSAFEQAMKQFEFNMDSLRGKFMEFEDWAKGIYQRLGQELPEFLRPPSDSQSAK